MKSCVHLGHRVFVGLAGELRFEQLFLQVGVVELGVGVGDFHAVDEQLEALGDRGVIGLALGERADAGRVVDDEHRADERLLDLGLEDFALDDVWVFAGRFEAEQSSQRRRRRPRRWRRCSAVRGTAHRRFCGRTAA